MLRRFLLAAVLMAMPVVILHGGAVAAETDAFFLVPNQTIEYTDATYTGTTWGGVPFGVGKMDLDNGDTIDGWWENGLVNGMGTYTWKNGDRFMGSFKNGKFDGPGIIYFADNSYSVYNWQEGKKEGAGFSISSTGQYIVTSWNNDKLVGNPQSDSGFTQSQLCEAMCVANNVAKDIEEYRKSNPSTLSSPPGTPIASTPPPIDGSVIESRIDGAFEGWDGDTIFKLVNGQIWQQSSYNYHYHYAYSPKVIIYKSGIRHKMHVDGTRQDIEVVRLK